MRTLAKLVPVLMFGLATAGCSMTLPVTGQMTTGEETFSGKATGYLDGAGTLELTSTKGKQCKGTFIYVTHRNGAGTFTCKNGQSGSFEFVSTGTRGTGTGHLGSQEFTFTFG